MAYCTSNDVAALIGEANLVAWSQLDPDGSGVDASRVSEAIATADAWIDDRLRGGRYVLPIVGDDGAVPRTVVDVSRRLAAAWLYSSRGTVDNDSDGDRMTAHREWADETINRIASGQITLAAAQVLGASHHPAVAP